MPVLLPNVLFDVHRSVYTTGKGTSKAVPYLYDQEGHVTTVPSRHLKMSAVGAVRIPYELRVELGTDIKIGDIITNMRLMDTGDTWIDDVGGLQTWRVVDPYDMTPGILGYRMLMIERVIGGGPAPV